MFTIRPASFEWNDEKAKANLSKHGVSFMEASTVFFDEFANIIDDPDHSWNEARYVILGRSVHSRLLVVCHCYREDDEVVRIISARKATKRESLRYWRRLNAER